MTDALFDMEPTVVAEPVEKLSADRRRTLRQKTDIANGIHPLTRLRVHDDPARYCGNCVFRRAFDYHNRRYLKCVWTPPTWSAEQVETAMPPRMSHSASTDVRNWWPGCRDHEYGDPRVSDDAARWVPGDTS